ncbi:MAG: hypothetical protein M0Z94_07425 [Dehalococcoidales bacterium]|nr:hypothetical protein [Dehalococcoidales bacterium]
MPDPPEEVEVVLRAEPLVEARVLQEGAAELPHLVALGDGVEPQYARVAAARLQQPQQ